MTIRQINPDWRFTIILTAAILLHVLMLFIPVIREVALQPDAINAVRVQLKRPPPVEEVVAVETQPLNEPSVVDKPLIIPAPIEMADVPALPPVADTPMAQQDATVQADVRTRILSRQFDYKKPEPLFGRAEENSRDRPDYYARWRPGLEDVLNEPSLQLPFPDHRIYLVDSYSPGISGNVERFFDAVTVPFGVTIKGTRIQCAWVMIIAGCSWGHVSLFHKKAKRRKADAQEEN